MCMEDIKIGRQATSSTEFVAVGESTTLAVPADPHRVALVFGCALGDFAYLSTDQNAPALKGISIGGSDRQLHINIRDHFDLVKRAWYVNGNGSFTMTVLSSSLAREQ